MAVKPARGKGSSGPGRDGGAGAGTKRRLSWKRRVLLVIVGGLFFMVLSIGVLYLFTSVPAAAQVASSQSTIVYDTNNRVIGRLHTEQDRVIIPFKEMPKVLREAVLSAEDRGFYHHGGVSIAGIFRAALSNVVAGQIKQGGSTITQQYVKNAFVGRERTILRKLKEALISVKLERSWSKDKILEAYLNTIYFGRGAYGIEAAARAYFGVRASRLTLEQSALIAGIIRAPSALDPSRNLEAATRARNRVLNAMAGEQYISVDDAAVAAEAPIKVVDRRSAVSGSAPYFLEAVRRELVARFGEDAVYRRGLRVRTTLDLVSQQAAEEAVTRVLDRPSDPQAALVSVDPKTGSVRALVGGRDFTTQKFDLATQAKRQPGSSFKPFVLATLLEQGGSLDDRFPAPATITLRSGKQTWTVSNYDHKGYGSLTVDAATENSVNTVYAQMILKVGPASVRDMAKTLGISSPLDPYASLALGTEEIAPFELADAYATFAADGMQVKAHMIASVKDSSGKELYRFSDSAHRALPQRTSRLVTRALQDVIQRGTGRSADLGRPAAGKTGTTENHRDAWFAGYTPDLATVVWMGFPTGSRTMENVRGIQVTGGSFPARIWKRYMLKALSNVPSHAFPDPLSAPSPSPSAMPSASASPSLFATTSPTPTPNGTVVPTPTPNPTATPTAHPSPSPTPTRSPHPSSTPSPSPSPSGSHAAAAQVSSSPTSPREQRRSA